MGQTVTVLASGNVKDIANAAPDKDSSNVKKAVTALAQGSAPAITEALKNAPIPPIPRSQPIAWLRKKTEVREDSSIECVTPVAKKPPAGSKSRPPLKKHIVRRSPAPDVLVVSEIKRKHTQKEQVPCPPIKKAKINPKGKQEETARNEMAHVIENARNSSPEPHAETHANAEIGRCKLPIQRIATPGEGKKAGPAAEAVKPAPKSRQLMRRRKDGVQKPTSQRDKSQEETSAARDKPASRRTCIDPKEDATVPRDRSPKNRDREVPSVKRPMRMTVSSVNSSVGTVKKSACEVRPGKILEESEDDDEVVEVEVTPQKQSPSSIIDVDLMNEDTSPVSKGRPPLPTPVGAVNKRNANARRLPRDPKPQDIVVGGLLKIWLRQSRLPGPTSGRGTAPSEKKE